MSLNDSKIRKLKPYSRPVKLSDSHGLYLLVNPGGSRIWYLKYRFNGKESRVSLGAYPLVSLAEARQQRDGIRKLLAQNINPAQQRMAEKSAVHAAGIGHGHRRAAAFAQMTTHYGKQSRAVYHVRRTLAPRRAISSLHCRMVYCP